MFLFCCFWAPDSLAICFPPMADPGLHGPEAKVPKAAAKHALEAYSIREACAHVLAATCASSLRMAHQSLKTYTAIAASFKGFTLAIPRAVVAVLNCFCPRWSTSSTPNLCPPAMQAMQALKYRALYLATSRAMRA